MLSVVLRKLQQAVNVAQTDKEGFRLDRREAKVQADPVPSVSASYSGTNLKPGRIRSSSWLWLDPLRKTTRASRIVVRWRLLWLQKSIWRKL